MSETVLHLTPTVYYDYVRSNAKPYYQLELKQPYYRFISSGRAFVIIYSDTFGDQKKCVVKRQENVQEDKFDALNWCLAKLYLHVMPTQFIPPIRWKYLHKYGSSEFVADVVKDCYSKKFLKEVYGKMAKVPTNATEYSFEVRDL